MAIKTGTQIQLVEMGARDGLQNEPGTVPATVKVELIERLAAAGLRRIEAGSFVSPRWIPQMADSEEVFRLIRRRPGVRYSALTPNLQGLDRAMQAGADEVAVFAAASEAFSQKNINCGIKESIQRFTDVCQVALEKGLPVRGYVSTAMGCPYQGKVPLQDVVMAVRELIKLGCYEVSIGDTIGVGTPIQVYEVLSACLDVARPDQLAMHFHDTYGQALANLRSGLELGIHTIDASVAGLGGCPYAKGASGNVATEDVLYMLHGMGYETGVDLDALVETSHWICEQLGRLNGSKVALALGTEAARGTEAVSVPRDGDRLRPPSRLRPPRYHLRPQRLHAFSISHRQEFWRLTMIHTGIITQQMGETILQEGDKIWQDRWFPDTKLNYAQNLLRFRDEQAALVFQDEAGNKQQLSYAELAEQTARLADWLKQQGIKPGDRIAGFAANRIETVVAMLAATSLGAVWSSCSPDFGVNGVLDRFKQITPRVLFAVSSHLYAGKLNVHQQTLNKLIQELPTLQSVVLLPELYENKNKPISTDNCQVVEWQQTQGDCSQPAPVLNFHACDFNDPLYIMYSSGTTGVPKCIVHGVGGTLLQHRKEHQLHLELTRNDVLFYFTTCGWMMWNWLVSGLASGATLVLFDGSPFHPKPDILFDLAEDTGITVFGTSARYLASAEKAGLKPVDSHNLSRMRALLSTGSPLSAEGFDYVWRDIKQDIRLQSISGGTDIISCFVLGYPWGEIHRGEIQGAGLGMDVVVLNENGQAVIGEKGELVCRQSFPSMPLGFWNDSDNSKYQAAYFERFADIYPRGVWTHGDYAEQTENGGWIIYGRSDTVLNPGGVRIGTAELYRQVELIEDVLECVAVGQEWENDVRIVLFVRLREGLSLDDALQTRIRQTIRSGASPRHVPAIIRQVQDIPRTLNGKIAETAVREALHGRPVKNKDALANPESLQEYTAG
ncbi:acetoacetate--CoA ligase [Pseudohongiella spirulinae]|uniref:hydroxymethylglutaryl-CoA lyase n=1 Tax=Pseudohongiella spirulinae TaxID=1249552 RepID=A0A0S2KDR2_9GAMM|nr:acetoacetate--CoA ligase [Pseudohongiella spirulinae]ALO46448.1 Acetoacetyl-CoA synthetase [Pseudohongiella spirulinae]